MSICILETGCEVWQFFGNKLQAGYETNKCRIYLCWFWGESSPLCWSNYKII